MDKVIFAILYVAFLVGLLLMSYKKRSKTFPVLFLGVLFVGAAFYLFQYGALSRFTLKALSAEASFVKEKVQEVRRIPRR